MVVLNPYAGTIVDMKLMFKEYTWPNKVRPKILSIEDAQINVVPDRSVIIQLGINRGIERSGGVVANRAQMFCNLAVFSLAAVDVHNILDDIYNCMLKTLDGDTPTQNLWYVSNRFSTIDKIVPAQMFSFPIARDPSRQEFFRGNMNLGIYIRS